MRFLYSILLLCPTLLPFLVHGQQAEAPPDTAKIEHADPVFRDLTTDLGARAGEGELNVNLGYRELQSQHHRLLAQLEMEFSPADDLGMEIILPYTVYVNNELDTVQRPQDRLEFLQWSTQYTFLKDRERRISMAGAFTNSFRTREPLLTEGGFNVSTIEYQPELIFGKNWNDRLFLLFTAGVLLAQDLELDDLDASYPITSAFHCKIGEDDTFVGVELNKEIDEEGLEMYVRPQVKLQVLKDFTLGLAIGIPVEIPEERWDLFLRLAYGFD